MQNTLTVCMHILLVGTIAGQFRQFRPAFTPFGRQLNRPGIQNQEFRRARPEPIFNNVDTDDSLSRGYLPPSGINQIRPAFGIEKPNSFDSPTFNFNGGSSQTTGFNTIGSSVQQERFPSFNGQINERPSGLQIEQPGVLIGDRVPVDLQTGEEYEAEKALSGLQSSSIGQVSQFGDLQFQSKDQIENSQNSFGNIQRPSETSEFSASGNEEFFNPLLPRPAIPQTTGEFGQEKGYNYE